ncbi:MAG: response regulator transcription factor [Anaerolineae bacterium]
MPLKVLLIESGSKDSHSLEQDLLERGHQVVVTHSPRNATSMAMADWPDLVIVNACAEVVDVEEVCQALDETRLDFPRLIVSRDEMHNHTSNDVHLVTPYSARQLTRRIDKAIGDQNNRFLRAGDIVVDALKRRMKRRNRIEHLTPKECKLLRLLIQHTGDVLDRGTIMKEVWETDYLGDTRTLDVHIRWLREKLEDDPSHPQYIVTVRGKGYRFTLPGSQAEW